LCAKCYQRDRRGLPPAADPERAPAGEADRVSLRLDKATRTLAKRAAKAAGMTETDWYRKTITERLAKVVSGRRPKR
jgi:uncharacterized protein (DUF1778 family)